MVLKLFVFFLFFDISHKAIVFSVLGRFFFPKSMREGAKNKVKSLAIAIFFYCQKPLYTFCRVRIQVSFHMIGWFAPEIKVYYVFKHLNTSRLGQESEKSLSTAVSRSAITAPTLTMFSATCVAVTLNSLGTAIVQVHQRAQVLQIVQIPQRAQVLQIVQVPQRAQVLQGVQVPQSAQVPQRV